MKIVEDQDVKTIIDHLNRSAVKINTKHIYRHLCCGKYSGIPLCCMIFFVVAWQVLFKFSHFSLAKKIIRWYPPGKYFNYVPCPFCFLFKRKVEIRNCSKDDLYCCQRKGKCQTK